MTEIIWKAFLILKRHTIAKGKTTLFKKPIQEKY